MFHLHSSLFTNLSNFVQAKKHWTLKKNNLFLDRTRLHSIFTSFYSTHWPHILFIWLNHFLPLIWKLFMKYSSSWFLVILNAFCPAPTPPKYTEVLDQIVWWWFGFCFLLFIGSTHIPKVIFKYSWILMANFIASLRV